jgi:hypothetical protein
MLNSQEEVIAELDLILDQLLCNATVMQKSNPLACPTEIALLNQTQESLIARFVHTQAYLNERVQSKKTKRQELLQEKMEKLDPALWDSLTKKLSQNPSLHARPRVGRNRKKLKTGKLSYCQF